MISEDFIDMDELTPEEAALFEGLLREKGVDLPSLAGIPRRAGRTEYPLSFAQQRLWFLDQLSPGNTQHNISLAVHLKGRLDTRALAAGLSEIARRHEVLRGTFHAAAGEPVQWIAPAAPVPLPRVDLRALPEAESSFEARCLTRDEHRRPFDLARGPLLRVLLVELAENRHAALATFHHIVSDAWSTGVLVRELGALYGALSAGLPSPLPELEIQYADFACWQRQRLSGELLERELAYWRERLEDPPSALELPTDRPRSARRTARGACRSFTVPAELVQKLRALGRHREATPFMLLLATFAALLHCYTGQEDFILGAPIAGRDQIQTEGLIGLFVNTLALRTSLAGEARFVELLGRIREVALGAFAHQELPFDKLVEEIRPERDALGSPLFQVTFSLQNTPLGKLDMPGLAVSALPVEIEATGFDLVLELVEAEGRLTGTLAYSIELFDAATVDRLARHFGNLLAAVAEEPGGQISALQFLDEAECHQLLVEWNDTGAWPEGAVCLHELFERQAERTPEAVAAFYAGGELTYRQLDERANRLARFLRRRGVGPDVYVGVCCESFDAVVGFLGILKAGGVYVPLDPAYPPERLRFLLEDSLGRHQETPLLLTQERLAGRFVDGSALSGRLEAVCLDTGAFDGESGRHLGTPVLPDHLAYVIYTSGSTGQPKGVVVAHRGLSCLWAAVSRLFAASEARVLQSNSLSFDASIWDIVLAFSTGSTLCLATRDELLPGPGLIRLLRELRITILPLPTSVLSALPREELPAVHTLVTGGEACSLDLARHWGKGRRLINSYGPSEATICATNAVFREESGRVPLGRPIDGTRLYVLDFHGRPVPLRIPGELHIGGQGLARGYLGHPELTAAAFLPDPFGGTPGGRLYRTGDVVRQLPDGEIEFLGRLGQQVKIRGFRVELGEIEVALRRHPEVRGAAVLAREDRTGGRRLVAYVVARGRSNAADLRLSLKGWLPEFMVPAAFVFLDALPLSPNGKLDVKALPEPDSPGRREGYVAPRTSVEEMLAGIWSDCLGVPEVGAQDDFFAMGGHSLLATRVVSRLRDAFGVELPLRTLFEQPTVALLAAAVEEERRSGAGRAVPAIEPARRDRPLPLSFAQQRLWFLHQLAPENAVYNIALSVGLEGALDPGALAASVCEVVRRHEALRTTFITVDGEPVQRIGASGLAPLPLIDLRTLSRLARREEARRLARREARRPFDLVAGPLLRTTLIDLGGEEHLLLLSLHHIVGDGWSLGVLVRELGTLYQAFAAGRPSPLPELELQYADFSEWQRRWLSGDVLAEEIAWWKERLGSHPPVLELPTDRPRPAIQTYLGGTCPVAIPAALAQELGALSRRQGTTLFMTLLTAFQALLGRYSGQDDIVVGTPVAGRTHLRSEELIGFFVNALVLRASLAGEPAFATLLRRVREATLSAYAHQDLPFEKLVAELQPQRDLSRSPLYQVVFSLDLPSAAIAIPGLTLRPLPREEVAAKFDLTLSLSKDPTGLIGVFEHNRDLFEGATVRRMGEHLTVLLAGFLEEPERRFDEIPLLTVIERHQLRAEWNDMAREFPQATLVHELLSLHAMQRPWTTAVAAPQARLTYGELEARSNRLAHHLRSLGVGPEVLVALCTERTLARVVGIVGVLKAGGAYVSLDPTYPRERLAFLLEDARAPVLLTERRFLHLLPESGAKVLCLDSEGETGTGPEDRAPESSAGPDNLAYVVYTSGSTGKPKGVEIPHAGLMNLVRWHQGLYGVTPEDRGTQIASPAFDASIWELWPYLAGGASVHIPEEEVRLSSPGMVQWWVRQGITLAYLMTPLAEGILEVPIPQDLHLVVRALIIGGDRLHRGPDPGVCFRLMNHYGPAEYTVTSTVVQVPAEGQGRGIPTIGRPVDNTSIYILSQSLESVPVGVPGELYVAGVGLARGYLRRPALTAERFLPAPFSEEPGARMYRTGDLVRYLPDGDMDFLGRLDHQVKLRGLRIELGEIETILGQHPAVLESAVLVREDRPGHKLLVGYVVAGERPALEDLRTFLKERLPEYMVPTLFVFLDALPLTPNGKVDRRALPAPQRVAEETYAAPRNAVEELLLGIWSELLEVERIGIEDDFFDLGGHSLLATRVISRVRETFKVELPLRKSFEAPTVAAFAAEIEAARAEGRGPAAPPIGRVPRDRPLALSFAQQRLWFMDRLSPGGAAYNIPGALELQGLLDVPVLARALAEIVRRHEALRTTFAVANDGPVQMMDPPRPVPCPVVDLTGLDESPRGREARRLAEQEVRRPFDLTRGPLLRVTLLRLAAASHAVLATMHHVASDGWSVAILTRELSALYRAFAVGKPSPLPELPVQYADFAAWQRRLAESTAMAESLAYWRRHLAGAPGLNLPIDHPRPASFSFRGDRHVAVLPTGPAGALRTLGRRQSVTPFMTLLAAFAVLLARWTGQEDVSVGTDVAGRNRAEIEGVIGCFVNNLVLRCELAGNPTFRELLGRVRELTLEAYAHQDLPFDLLVRELKPERTLSHMPLFQVLLVLQNAPGAALDLPGLTLRPMELAADSVKFDLALFASETEEGIVLAWRYSPDLFTPVTIARMAGHLENVLHEVCERPDAHVQQLEVVSPMRREEAEQSRISRLRSARDRSAARTTVSLVDVAPAVEGRGLPLMIRPRVRDLDLAGWARGQREMLDAALLRHGALLFRDFRVSSVAEFEQVARAVCPDLFGEYGDLPREQEGEKVYHSTPYPADKTILFHNESSHLHRWPLKQFFYCVQAAAAGGETPLVDSREVYRRLRPEIAARFRDRKLMYVRNFIAGFDVSWQEFFHTDDRAEVERFCREANMELRWKGEGLEVRQIAPAVVRHPKSGELVFFNQIQLHHVATLEPEVRRSLLSVFSEEDLPRTVRYGDGSPIEDALVEEVTALYWECSVALPWQEGDVIALDNMLCAHARNPFSGPRKIVVAMGELLRSEEVT